MRNVEPISPADGLPLLALKTIGPDTFVNEFSKFDPSRRVYGGQALAQALACACATVEGKTCHSLHAYFLTSASAEKPVTYKVERVRDGASFAVRRVVARQDGKDVIHLECSFHSHEGGFQHQSAVMPDVPSPDDLSDLGSVADRVEVQSPLAAAILRSAAPMDVRLVDPGHFLEQQSDAVRRMWVKMRGAEATDDATAHQQLIAYMSDYWLFGTPLVRHPIRLPGPQLVLASLDHAIWFHRPHRADEWLLLDCESPVAGGARGLSRGHLFNQAGDLVATVMQESLLRIVHDQQSR